jgi:hypothetical protein
MKYDGLVGEIVHLVPAITFPFTVEQLGLRTPEMLAALNIDSGEHIAAILVSAFLGTVPAAVDLDGGVDLVFTNLSPSVEADVGCGEVVSSACFEVKSMSSSDCPEQWLLAMKARGLFPVLRRRSTFLVR